MRLGFLALAFCLSASVLHCENMEVGGDVSGTVKVGGMDVALNHILVTPKADHVHIIWDSFPQHAAIAKAGKAFSLGAAALDIAKSVGHAADAKAVQFRVDVSEFPVRDDYGAPRWDKVTFLGRFVVTRSGDKWSVAKRKD